MASSAKVRRGVPADVPAVLRLLDEATEWLVAQGRTDQWGTEPQSADPRQIEQLNGFAAAGDLWVAELDVPVASVVGALAIGPAMPYVPAATELELYIRLLVTDRQQVGRGIGTMLLDQARSLAQADGIGLLRLDCFAGRDNALIRYYEKQGFTRAEQFAVQGSDSEWLGQVLFQRLGVC